MCDTPLGAAVPCTMLVLCMQGCHRALSQQLSGSMGPLVVIGSPAQAALPAVQPPLNMGMTHTDV